MNITSKPCRSCKATLPLSEYHTNKSGLYGRQSMCKKCTHDKYYLPNKGKVIASQKARRATDAGKENERNWRNAYRFTHRLKRLLQEAKTRAKKRGFAFDVTEEELSIPQVCPVLGIPITLHAARRADGSPSLERIDRDKGYVSGNVIVISWRANRIKSDASIHELEKIVDFYRRDKK